MIRETILAVRERGVVAAAITPRELIAKPHGRGGTLFRARLAPLTDREAWRRSVAKALVECARGGPRKQRLRLVLLPPLAEARLIPLPLLTSTERRQVLRRDWNRYCPAGEGEVVADGVPIRGSKREGILRPHLVAGVPAWIAEALETAAAASGFALESVSHSTLELGRLALARFARSRDSAAALLPYEDRIECLVRSARGALALRRLPRSASETEVVDAIELPSDANGERSKAHSIVLCDADEGRFRHVRLERTTMSINLATLLARSDPAGLAADSAPSPTGPNLVPAHVFARGVRATWRRAGINIAVGAATLLLATGVRAIELSSQLAAIRRDRAQLVRALPGALRVRDSVALLSRELRYADSLARNLPEVLPVLAQLSGQLPAGAWLESIRIRADTVTLRGHAARADEVFVAVRALASAGDVRFATPVEQVGEGSEDVSERFALRATLRGRTSALTSPVAAAVSRRER